MTKGRYINPILIIDHEGAFTIERQGNKVLFRIHISEDEKNQLAHDILEEVK